MKFTEEQLQKIRESLLANGVPEDVVEFTIADLKGEVKEEAAPEAKEGDPTETPEEGNPDDQAPIDDVPPAPVAEPEGEPAPVVEPPVEEVPPVAEEVPPEVPPVEQPPVEDVPPAVPGYDDSELRGQVNDLIAQLEEQKAANDGLIKRVESLEEALRVSGILVDEGETTPVGDETPRAPANNPEDDPIDGILAQLNGHKY